MVEANPSANVQDIASRQGATTVDNLDEGIRTQNYQNYVHRNVSAEEYAAADAGDPVV